MTDDLRRTAGPGSGPGGAPTAIALSPILSARYRAQDLERISAKFHERRQAKKSPFERAVMRLTGMDVKMEQYRKGELFVSAIAKAGGPAALNRLWSGPDALPRHGEIDDPKQWLARMEATATA